MRSIFAVLVVLVTGCGGSKPPEAKTETELPAEYFRVDPATAGKVRGRISYGGPKPERLAIKMESDASCAEAHAGKPVYDEPVAVGKDGGLANAFVYIQAADSRARSSSRATSRWCWISAAASSSREQWASPRAKS